MFGTIVYILTIALFAYALYEYLTCEENYEPDEHEDCLAELFTKYGDNRKYYEK